MAKTRPFDRFPDRYDHWFQEHEHLYQLELKAIKALMPAPGTDMEIGVGSGRFASPLGIRFGVEPSMVMAERAKRKGIEVAIGIAEQLPIKTSSIDTALMVTTICFVDDITTSFIEAKRVLRPGGAIVVGFVDRESFLGKRYLNRKEESVFYKEATFFSSSEVLSFLANAGFTDLQAVQTILPDDNIYSRVEQGHGRGGFVVIKGEKHL